MYSIRSFNEKIIFTLTMNVELHVSFTIFGKDKEKEKKELWGNKLDMLMNLLQLHVLYSNET